MKALFKLLLGVFGTLALLLVIAAIALPLIYDTQDLKRVLAAELREATGRDVQIDGDLDFSVFPWIAVEVNEMHLGNAEGFGDRPFASIGKARIGVALMPLLHRRIEVDQVTIDGLALSLAVDSAGRNNWDGLAGAADSSPPPEEQDPARFSSRRIAGLNVRDASIEFEDRQAGTHYRLSAFSLETGPIGDGAPLPLELAALLEDPVAKSAADVTLSATATIDLERSHFQLSGVRFSLNPRGADGEPGAAPMLTEAPQVVADLAAQTLEVSSFDLALPGFEASGALTASRILDNPAFSGTIATKEFSPARLMRELGMEPPATSDPDVMQTASLRTRFEGNPARTRLQDLELNLDQSRMTGSLDIQATNPPKIGFDLNVDRIDLDRYLAPAEAGGGPEAIAMPKDELSGLDVDGRLRVSDLRMAGLTFSDASVGVLVRTGRLRLNPLTAGFYGGTYNGDVALDGSGAVPVISLDETIDSITLARLLGDLADHESLSGLAKGHLRLTGRGATSAEVLGSLNGELGLSLSDGALEGINVWHEIRKGMAKYKGLAPPPPEPDRTVFSRMQVDALVSDGVVNTRQLVAELPFLTLTGQGSVDLGRSITDLRLVAAVRKAPELANDPLTAELTGRKLPFRVSGPLDAPQVTLDVETLLKGEATDLLLDKLGLGSRQPGPGNEGEAAPETGTPDEEAEEQPSGDSKEKAAANALFQILQGATKDKKKEPDEEEQNR
jgi:AsmA protein